MAKPIIAIVGRPNVGKSTLFNKLVGQRLSIVKDTPGVTRDRIYSPCEWRGKEVMLVDTGGIEPYSNDVILSQMRRQAQLAIESADVIVLVTDLRTGVTANDQEVASMLLKSGKPVVLCVNKVDTIGDVPPEYYEFYNLGLGDPIPVSSVHGHGTGDLLDACFEHIDFENREEYDEEYIKVAIIGKPNVGKSSLVNRMTGQERAIVSNIAGTTRDATDSILENEHGKYVLIDTAGIRRKSRVDDDIEKYSVLVPIWQWTGRMSASSSSMPLRASPSRIPRWQAMPMNRARPALWSSTSGMPWKRTARPWMSTARSWRMTSPS